MGGISVGQGWGQSFFWGEIVFLWSLRVNTELVTLNQSILIPLICGDSLI